VNYFGTARSSWPFSVIRNQPALHSSQSDGRVARNRQPFLDIAKLYSKSKNPTGMRNAMKAYLERAPKDWRAWLDLASLDLQHGDPTQAGVSLGAAIRYGGSDAQRLIQSNPDLKKIRQNRDMRTKNLMGLGL
jgi:hypothetical protein